MVYDSNQINIIQNKFEDLRFLPTNIDILGVLIYFSIAGFLLQI